MTERAIVNVMGSSGHGTNPFVRLMMEAVRRDDGVAYRPYSAGLSLSRWPDVWHFNWPEAAYRSGSALVCALKCAKLILQIDAARARGTKIVWMVHNFEPHNMAFPRVETRFWSAFRRRVHAFIHLSPAGGEWFRQVYASRPNQRHYHLRHPVYTVGSDERAIDARNPGTSPVRLLMFGYIQPYKDVPSAIAAFRETEPRRESELHVVGKPVPEALRSQVVAAAGADPRIALVLKYLPDDELDAYVRSSDAVVIPYTDFLNSGVLMYALSHNIPVLAPSTPVTREMADEVGPDWVYLYDGSLDAGVFERLTRLILERRSPVPPPNLAEYQWTVQGPALAQAYHEIVQTS